MKIFSIKSFFWRQVHHVCQAARLCLGAAPERLEYIGPFTWTNALDIRILPLFLKMGKRAKDGWNDI